MPNYVYIALPQDKTKTILDLLHTEFAHKIPALIYWLIKSDTTKNVYDLRYHDIKSVKMLCF